MEIAKKDKKEKLPDWWKKETPEFQAMYIAEHPKSKFAKTLKDTKKATLKANPKLRKQLRSAAKSIAADSSKILPKEKTDKLSSKSIEKALPEAKVKEMKADLTKEAKGSKPSKKFQKHMITALKVAGLLALGGAVLATGGLPYVILGAHLLKDGKEAFQSFKSKVADGEEALSAMATSTKEALDKALKDPNLIQTAMIASNHSKLRGGKGRKGSTHPKAKPKDSKEADD